MQTNSITLSITFNIISRAAFGNQQKPEIKATVKEQKFLTMELDFSSPPYSMSMEGLVSYLTSKFNCKKDHLVAKISCGMQQIFGPASNDYGSSTLGNEFQNSLAFAETHKKEVGKIFIGCNNLVVPNFPAFEPVNGVLMIDITILQ